MKYFLVASLGLVGIFSRYAVNSVPRSSPFPWGTLGINLVGSLLIGVVYYFGVVKSQLSDELKTALMVGLLGGFTTFSAFSLEAWVMIKQGAYGMAATYVFSSIAGGILLCWAGFVLSSKIAG